MADVSICLWGWTPSLPHAQSVTLLTYSHTPPLCLPSGSWHSGVISSSQLLWWRTTDWTSSCWGLQQQCCFIICGREHQETGVRMKHMAFGVFGCFPYVLIMTHPPNLSHQSLIGLLKQKQRLNDCKHLVFILSFSTNTEKCHRQEPIYI